MDNVFDVIIIGAGYSGLCASYHLKKLGIHHVVLERHKIGDSWRSRRWDNFRFNSTNKLNVLPGEDTPDDPDSFGTAPAFVAALKNYVARHHLPVRENSKVISVEKPGEYFELKVRSGDIEATFVSRQVLIASGAANEIKIPSIAKGISPGIKQLHTCEYKNSSQLPAGAILVVGGGQSGIQITEDLINAGRRVYFSTSKVGRIPRWYRGRDIFYWLKDMKFFDETPEEGKKANDLDLRPPHVAGTGNGRYSLSLQSLAKRGAIILGTLGHADKTMVHFEPNAADHVRFADAFSQKIKNMVDAHIVKNRLDAPVPHYDEADLEDPEARCVCPVLELDLNEQNINTIIWSTGFNHDYSFIRLPVFDEQANLVQKNGIPLFPGLYFLGYPWLRNKRSSILFGIIEDVDFVIDHIFRYAKGEFTSTPAE